MSDDWGWYFTSAERRTSILRGEVEAANAAARAQSSRLSSQLRTLQGSIESRLNALSAAFDAYVELGDIREQLAGFPDTTVVRRDVADAIDALAQGRQAERVDDRGETYWLPNAANAVIGIIEGHPDAEAEATAHALSPDAELFIVAACGALGRGSAVAERLPALLTCDERLNDDQLALWQCAVERGFGPVLADVRPVWAGAVEQANADVGGWRAWCRGGARTADVETTVDWIAALLGVGGTAIAAPQPVVQPVVQPDTRPDDAQAVPGATQLRAVVTRLVAQGTDQEAPLLNRARELRERIEHPGSGSPIADAPDEPTGSRVIDVVRHWLLATSADSPERAELLSWAAPGLMVAAEAEAASLAALEPISERVGTAGTNVDVTSSGPEPGQLEQARASITARYPTSPTVSRIAATGCALFAVVTVIALVAGSGWGFLTAIIAVAIGIGLFRTERARRERRVTAQATLAQLESGVAAAQDTVSARIDAREITRTRVSSTLEAIRATAPEPAGVFPAGGIPAGGVPAGGVPAGGVPADEGQA